MENKTNFHYFLLPLPKKMTKYIKTLEVGHICLTTAIPLPVIAVNDFQSSLFFFQLPNSLYYEGWQVIMLMGGGSFLLHNMKSCPSCSHFPYGPRSLLSTSSSRLEYRSTSWTFGPLTLSNGATSWKSTATLGKPSNGKQWNSGKPIKVTLENGGWSWKAVCSLDGLY